MPSTHGLKESIDSVLQQVAALRSKLETSKDESERAIFVVNQLQRALPEARQGG